MIFLLRRFLLSYPKTLNGDKGDDGRNDDELNVDGWNEDTTHDFLQNGSGNEIEESNEQPQQFSDDEGDVTTPAHFVRRSTCVSRPPPGYSPSLHYILYTDKGEPETFQDAISSPDADKWKAAMKEELDALKHNDT